MLTNIKYENNINNPWKGLNFYHEGEILYGRDNEIQSLALYVTNNTQTVLYGKSGIGKSSIINAGVFPIARKEGLFPIPIRLKHDSETDYTSQIKAAFKDSAIGISEILPPLDNSHETLWEYLHRNEFYDKEIGHSVRPLIVLDQFEEIFTLQHDEKKKLSFFSELADLLNEITPNYIAKSQNAQTYIKPIISKSNDDAFSFDFGVAHDSDEDKKQEYISESLFNIVFTIREDFLSYLERYTKYIPVMKSNRYALLPINEEQAKDIIMKPVEGLIDIKVAKLIIEKVTGRTDFTLGDAPEIDVDAAVLSLFLSRLYIKKGEDVPTVTATLVNESSKDIIKDFYIESVSDLPTNEIERLEDLLLTYDNRRDNVSRNDLLREGISDSIITTLVEDRKLLRQFSYQEDIRIEFIHDILCPIVNDRIEHREQLAKEREEQKKKEEEDARREKERQEMERRNQIEAQRLEDEKRTILRTKARNRRITAFLSVVALGLGALTFAVILMSNRNDRQKRELDALNEEIRSFLPSLIEQRINDGDTYSAGMLLMRLFPDSQYVEWDPIRTSLFRKISGSHANLFMGHSQAVNVGTFSNDGRTAFTGSDDMTLKMWDTATGHLMKSINFGSPVTSLAVSPNGKRLAVSTKDGYLKLFSIEEENLFLLDSLGQDEDYARYITFNPNGSRLMVCDTKGKLLICDASKLSIIDTKEIGGKGLTYISYDKKGQRMALAGTNNTIMIWDALNMTPITSLNGGHTDWVRSVEFSPDGNKLVSCSDDKTVRLWDLSSRSNKIIAQLPAWGTKAMFSNDGKRIITSCRDGYLRFIDVKSLCEIPELAIRHNGYLNQFDLSPDGSQVITCSTDPVVHTWDCGSTMETDFSRSITGAVYGLALYDEGQRFAAVSNEGMLGTWDIKTKKNLFLLQDIGNGRQRRASSLCVSPDGKIIAISTGSNVRLFDCNSGKELEINNEGGHRGWIRNMCFSHDGKILASVGADKRLVLWDVENKKVCQRLPGNNMLSGMPESYSIDFSKDDHKIVTGAVDGSIRQWNIHNGEQIGDPIYAHRAVVLSVHYNSNDSLILSSSGDQTACLSKTDGTLLRQFVGASGFMCDVIFGMTEDEIITASADKYIRIWCVTNGEEIIRLGGHLGSVSRLSLSKDGTLVSGDVLGRLVVWKIPSLKKTANTLYQRYNK